MCYRYVSPAMAAIVDAWELDAPPGLEFSACYNVAPTSQVPVLRSKTSGGLVLERMRWGLVPSWWKQEKLPALTFNARSEEAAQKPVWRDSFRQGRCLLPALGWYEWQTVERRDPRSGRTGKVKEPFFIHCPTTPVMVLAGLWAHWRSPQGQLLSSCAILTRAASSDLALIHERMPVVLPAETQGAWLSSRTEAADLKAMLGTARTDMACYRVGEAVNRVGPDEPGLMVPWSG